MTDDFVDPFTDTFEDIKARMLSVLTDLYPNEETRPGSRDLDLYGLLSTLLATELEANYASLNASLAQSFVQYASENNLDILGDERGVPRNAAVGATGQVAFMGEENTTVPFNTTVSTASDSAEEETYLFATTAAGEISVAEKTFLENPSSAPTVDTVGYHISTVNAGSSTSNAIYRITLTGATGGDFTVTWDGQTTGAIAYNASAATVDTALEALSNIGVGDVTVTGSAGGPWDIEFTGALANTEVVRPTITGTGLTGSTAGNITGDAVYKFVYQTTLADYYAGRGYTEGSPASGPAITLSGEQAFVMVPPLVWTDPAQLVALSEVRVYRSYMSISDVAFSEYKYVGSIYTNPADGGVFTDDLSDADFLLIDEDAVVSGTLPDTNSTGVVFIDVLAVDAGEKTNVLAGSIELLEDETPGIEAVTNFESFTDGADEETDDEYRERILEKAQKAAGDGNVSDYEVWAKEVDGIFNAKAIPEWDGPGTVKVVVSGSGNSAITDEDRIEEVRQYIAGDVAIDNPTTNPITFDAPGAGSVAAGDYEYTYTFVEEGGGETEPAPAVSYTNAGTASIELLGIPLGPTGVGPEDCVKRRIYRRKTSGTPQDWALVTEIENNVLYVDYSDVTAYASLPAVDVPGGDPVLARGLPETNSTSKYEGKSPIGAHVTVVTVSELDFFVSGELKLLPGYSLVDEENKVNVVTLIGEGLQALAASLTPGDDLKYIDVMNVIHDTAGVSDFQNIEITALPTYVGVTTNILAEDNTTFVVDVDQLSFTEY